MSSAFRALRRQILAPSLASVSFAGRGFAPASEPATAALEPIPRAVVCGFEWGMEADNLWELERRLDLVTVEQRGFAYEGAAMAYTIRDSMAGGRTARARELLLGPARPHIFLTYIGIGFAMARLPRVLWKNVLPELSGSPYHPTMSWLAVDGYGFDKAYFDTRRWVDEQRLPEPYPWQGSPEYFLRAFDQGVGRALWFVHGAGPEDVAAAVQRYDGRRQADLWSGVGLAATFAGGCRAADLAALRGAAGDYLPELRLGVTFAVKARSYAGHVPKHTKLASAKLTGMSVEDVVAVADATEVTPAESGSVPAYEAWRQRIREHFATANAASGSSARRE